ncbi:MAG: hypothetical protein NWR72_07105 [Bacteroidia bacterium]|nr:hypothetical protein [Bacteroidia bacterium]
MKGEITKEQIKEAEKNNLPILLRDLVPRQGRKTEFGEPNEDFSDAGLVQEIKPKADITF